MVTDRLCCTNRTHNRRYRQRRGWLRGAAPAQHPECQVAKEHRNRQCVGDVDAHQHTRRTRGNRHVAAERARDGAAQQQQNQWADAEQDNQRERQAEPDERIARSRGHKARGPYGFRLGATNGLVSTPDRLFLSKQASRRPRAAVLPSSGTRSVAPSPLTSSTSAIRNPSLRARSAKVIVTVFGSARALASNVRGPVTRRTV